MGEGMTCVTCLQEILVGSCYILCNVCRKNYHLKCANLSTYVYLCTMSYEEQSTWNCQLCSRMKLEPGPNSNSRIRTQITSVISPSNPKISTKESKNENITLRKINKSGEKDDKIATVSKVNLPPTETENRTFIERLELLLDGKFENNRTVVLTEIKELIRSEIKELIGSEIKERIGSQIKDIIKSEIEDCIKTENKELLRSEIKELIKSEVKQVVNSQVKELSGANNKQIKSKMSNTTHELKNELIQNSKKLNELTLDHDKTGIEIEHLKEQILSIENECVKLNDEIQELKGLEQNPKTANNTNNTKNIENDKKIVLRGLKEDSNETRNDLHSRIINIFQNYAGINLTCKIEDLYRIGKPKGQRRPVVIELVKSETQHHVLQHIKLFKNTGMTLTKYVDKDTD